MEENKKGLRLKGSLEKLKKILFKIFWSAFCAFALLAFSDILDSTIVAESFHFNFSTAIRAEEFLCTATSTRVFTGSGHNNPPIDLITLLG